MHTFFIVLLLWVDAWPLPVHHYLGRPLCGGVGEWGGGSKVRKRISLVESHDSWKGLSFVWRCHDLGQIISTLRRAQGIGCSSCDLSHSLL